MLLHVKFPGVKGPGVAEGSELLSWKDPLQKFAGGEGTQYKCPLVIVQMGLERKKRTATGQRWHQQRYQDSGC